MNFYNPETIKRSVPISRYLEDQGVKVRGNRAVAAWRDGQRESVSIDDDKGVWHDFVADEGGDVIALCIKIEGGSFLSACRTLGDRYNLAPDKVSRKPKKATRGEMLVHDGFTLVRTYTYQNADGTPRYYVDRFERINADGKREKEFVQRTDERESLEGVEKTIYNLPAVVAASRVFLVEGEKDADTLTRLGLTATTNSGGAKFWSKDFNRHFEGKDVVVLPDNDDVGKEHGVMLAGLLAPVARSVRILTISKLPKGDVTDWMEKEGGSLSALIEAVNAAPSPDAQSAEVAAAKLANEKPLKNYTSEWYEDDNGKRKERRHPRKVDDICDEMATRFLGFPKRIGGLLFDHTRTTPRRIETFATQEDLRAWINGTSGHQSEFQNGGAFASYKEVMARLLQTRPRYDVIANAPWYPARDDAYAAYDALPNPDATRSKVSELLAFFNPATDADRTLMLAFFMAPLYHTSAARPAWIVDTVDAQASGKTAVIKACAWLYAETPLGFDLQQLGMDVSKVKREILSSEGRAKRIVLFDNVTSSLKSGALADFITAQSITGMAPYGKSVETRTNDITWCATVNSASVDTDMATRSYVIHIRAPATYRAFWERDLKAFIETNRSQLHADFMDMMRTAPQRLRKMSRFGEFDSTVLSAACATDAEFVAADDAIRAASEAANDDADLAAQCVEAINDALMEYDGATPIAPDTPIILRCSDVDAILKATKGGVRNWTSKTVRRFVNAGHIRQIKKGFDAINTDAAKEVLGRVRVFLYAPQEALLANPEEAQVVTFSGGRPSVLGIIRLKS